MYAKFGCCTMLPNRAQIGPQIRISDKGEGPSASRAVMSMTLTNQVQLFQCHGPIEMGAVRQRVV